MIFRYMNQITDGCTLYPGSEKTKSISFKFILSSSKHFYKLVIHRKLDYHFYGCLKCVYIDNTTISGVKLCRTITLVTPHFSVTQHRAGYTILILQFCAINLYICISIYMHTYTHIQQIRWEETRDFAGPSHFSEYKKENRMGNR